MNHRISTVLLVVIMAPLHLDASEVRWQYPCRINSRSMLECDCWTGIEEEGNYDDPIVYVDPER